MFRKALMKSVAVAACALALGLGSAAAQTGPNDDNVLQPFWGNISPFYGNISPFYGNISPFWGNITPFWGNISPFEGNVAPFWGNISPFYGNISPFWGNISPFWGNISPFMSEMQTAQDPAAATAALRNLRTQSEVFWGPSVAAQTGQSFQNGFVTDLYAKYGLGADGGGFGNLAQVDRARFLFDWYDGLMAFSGRDHVDYWMSNVRWNPALAQSAGGGAGVVIGMFDFTPTGANLTNLKEWKYEGYDNPGQGHGAAVASLLVSDYDGVGMMGLAPNAVVAGYNPFDQSGTASWDEISEGVFRLKKSGASVVNMSLGVPGLTFAPEWNGVYTAANVKNKISDVVFVHAAGNEGVSQTQNIAWNFSIDPTFLVVGSVGPNGVISDFSNRPGTACLTDKGACRDMLMNRFLVAPGEWILTSDGQGGVTRMSGTSFAAPQVTGAIALLHSRWAWLKSNPADSANIILRTAKDLGAPGVDAVYGRGLLDVTASQSPLDLNKLYQLDSSGNRYALVGGSGGALLGASEGYVTVFEDVGATYRDFIVPLNATLTNGNTSSGAAIQGHLLNSLQGLGTPVTTTTTTTTTSSKTSRKKKFSDDFAALASPFGFDLGVMVAPLPAGSQAREGELPYAFAVSVTGNTGASLMSGRGYGASALTGSSISGAASHEASLGGSNPILGFASGGAYVASSTPLGAGLSLNAGFTERKAQAFETDTASGEERPIFESLDAYRAAAAHVSLRQQLNQSVAVNAGYTFLREDNGLLGLQSANPGDFAAGTRTDAATIGAEWAVSQRLGFAASVTMSRTRAQPSNDQSLAVNKSGVTASAFEATVNLDGVIGKKDRAYLRLAQPLHVDGGGLNVTNVEVVDRETGALGEVTRQVDLSGGARKYLVEGAYVSPVLKGRGQIAALARLDASQEGAEPVEQVIGARFSLNF
jgi:hypothetical protein